MIGKKDWKYLLLENGDIIKEGDEYYNPKFDEWLKVDNGLPDENGNFPDAVIGYEWDPEEYKPMRRKLSKT